MLSYKIMLAISILFLRNYVYFCQVGMPDGFKFYNTHEPQQLLS